MKFKNLLAIVFSLLITVSFAQKKSFASLKQGIKKNETADPRKLEQEVHYAERPETAGTEVVIPKDNVIPKNETFDQKITRYKLEGFKIGVAYFSGQIYTKQIPPPDRATSGTEQWALDGYLPSMNSELKVLVVEFVQQMNDAFSTDVFELVDLSIIPVRKTMGAQSDDWWKTKYATVFYYIVTPQYDYNKSMGTINGDFVATASVTAMEYYLKKGKEKMKIVVGGKTIANYRLNYDSESLEGLTSIEELNSVVNPPSGSEIATTLLKIQTEEGIEKVIEKLK